MQLIILVGPSCSGKTSIARAMLKLYPEEIAHFMTYTTRPPRDGDPLTYSNQEPPSASDSLVEIEEFAGHKYWTTYNQIGDARAERSKIFLGIGTIARADKLAAAIPGGAWVRPVFVETGGQWEDRMQSRFTATDGAIHIDQYNARLTAGRECEAEARARRFLQIENFEGLGALNFTEPVKQLAYLMGL